MTTHTEPTADDVLGALHAVALEPTAFNVALAREALKHAGRWDGWEIASAARDAETAIAAYERADRG